MKPCKRQDCERIREAMRQAAWDLLLASVLLQDHGSYTWADFADKARAAFALRGKEDDFFESYSARDLLPRVERAEAAPAVKP